MNCRILKTKICKITQKYKEKVHDGIDLVDFSKGYSNVCDVVAHSDGEVVELVKNCNQNTNGKDGHVLKKIYGNYVKIKHQDGYYTLYAHLKYGSVKVKKGDKVKKGNVIGTIGNTGYSFGAHLHFEVRNTKDKKIDPTPYLDADFSKKEEPVNKYKLGDMVTINGVYQSSMSDKKLRPLITKGKITRIVENAKNPYLLNDGNIGWINDGCVVSSTASNSVIYTVKAGDTLSSIAAKYNTTWQNIYEKNSKTIGSNPNLIHAGQKLVI